MNHLDLSRDMLKLRLGITGPATLKYRLEDEMIAEYVAQRQQAGDTRDAQDIAVAYNDTVIYPDKVRLNCLNSEVILNTDLHGLNG